MRGCNNNIQFIELLKNKNAKLNDLNTRRKRVGKCERYPQFRLSKERGD